MDGGCPLHGTESRTDPLDRPVLCEMKEADQVPEGRLVDALVPRGDEGRGTLR